MTWPIPTLPTNWANASPQADAHPLAHNQLADAINELYARLPRGLIAAPKLLAGDQLVTSAAGVTDITGLTFTWTAEATRYYRITLEIGAGDLTVANGRATAYITDGANGLKRNAAMDLLLANPSRATFNISVIEGGLSGSQTRKARIGISGGSINLVANTQSYAPRLTVEDIGKV